MTTIQTTFNSPEGENLQFLKNMTIKGLKHKGVYDDPWYQEQLNVELDVIKKTGVEDFFLQTAYICALIDDAGIFRGPARGSCLASVVCYGLNITKIPPKPYNLSFARFLNETRVMTQLPDIDTDVSSSDRDTVLQLIMEEFGEDNCGQVITRTPYTVKTAIQALNRMIDGDRQEGIMISKMIPDDAEYTQIPKVMEFLNRKPFIRDNIHNLLGIIKSHGKHAGALIIFDKPLYNYTSIVKVKDSFVISNNGSECEDQGFLKNDTLGIAVLDIQRDCLKLINDPNVQLPYTFDDPEVFKTICKNQLGLFQLEKAAGRQCVQMVQPENFNELVATISLIRPGARNSGMDKLYCDYKFGRKEPEYLDPRLKDILKDTQGLMIFQEDSMAVARELAGMSDLETDHLRRAISKKKKEAFTEFKPKFLQGCINNNVKEAVAQKLWDTMEKSSDYSFNRSHAVGYAVLGYQSAWLKTYYPLEFAVAMLMHSPSEEKRVEILQSIKDSNAILHSPDINKSQNDTVIVNNNIYMGLGLIDKISEKVSEAIIDERDRYGDFKSFDDFCQRIAPRKANKAVKQNLIWAGAFDNILITNNEDCITEVKEDEMQTISEKRSNLINFFFSENNKYSVKDILYKEYIVLSFSPRDEYIDTVKTQFDNLCVDLSTYTFENTSEFYMKGIITDVDRQNHQTILHVRNKDVSVSVTCRDGAMRLYDDFFVMGEPVIIKGSTYNGRVSLGFLVALNKQNLFFNEQRYMKGISFELVTDINSEVLTDERYGVIVECKWVKTSSGKDMLRGTLFDGDKVRQFGTMKNTYNKFVPIDLKAGDFVCFRKPNHDFFINNMRVVSL